MNETLYTLSPCIISPKEAGGMEFFGLLSKRRFTISHELTDMLVALDAGKTQSEIMQMLSETLNGDDAEQCFAFLTENEVISDINIEPASYYLKKAALPIWGFRHFQKPERNKIVFVGIPSGIGNNIHFGCAKFPTRIRQVTNTYNLLHETDELTLDFIHHNLESDSFKALIKQDRIKDGGDLSIDTFEDREVVLERIREMAGDLFAHQNVPFFLGGDHLITLPVVSGLWQQYEQIQVIQFDAHTDTYRTAEDNRGIIHHGNFMKHLLKEPHVNKVIQIGVRGLSNMRQTKPDSKQEIISGSRLARFIEDDEAAFNIDPEMPAYISFDIDFMNAIYAPGTNTPVGGGLSYEGTFRLLKKVLSPLKNIVGMDLVEVNPDLDERNRTMETAAELILTLLSFLKV